MENRQRVSRICLELNDTKNDETVVVREGFCFFVMPAGLKYLPTTSKATNKNSTEYLIDGSNEAVHGMEYSTHSLKRLAVIRRKGRSAVKDPDGGGAKFSSGLI